MADIMIASIVLGIEIGVLILLFIGWRYGARRLHLNLHHWVIWGSVAIQIGTVALWMVPRIILFLPSLLTNITENLYLIIHGILGLMTVILGICLVILFLVRRDIPLSYLKKGRKFMFLALFGWIAASILGISIYLVFYG